MAGILSVQINSVLGDEKANMEKIRTQLEKHSDKHLDLVLFPEFFSTSIDYQKHTTAEDGGDVIREVCELAKQYNTNIVAGTVVRKVGDKYYNTSFAVNRKGEVVAKYDKIHLFNYMGGNEGEFTSAGNEMVTVDFDFAKVGMAICFDVRYPLLFNKLIKENVDIITLPTAWLIPEDVYKNNLDKAKDMWRCMLKTRAYDNMVYFVVCNQTGKVNNDLYGIGNSMIISPTSNVIAQLDEEEEGLYCEIDKENVDFMRAIYPIASID